MKQWVAKCRREGALVGFIGGPPCPDFSVGGKGCDGSNGRLSQTYIDLIVQQKPDFFLFENVKGLWKTKRHKEFYQELKKQPLNPGFQLVERLINAIEYGAPQDRERIILIGFRSEILNTKLTGDLFAWENHTSYPGKTAFEANWVEQSGFSPDSVLSQPLEVPVKLTVEYWFQKNEVENHPNSKHYFQPRNGLARFLSVNEGDVGKKSYKRLHRWRYSPTAAYGNNEVHLHPYKARRISVAEALAIQSLPKEFELPGYMTLSNMFKCVGNGVPFLAARGLAKTISDFLSSACTQKASDSVSSSAA